MSKLSKLVTDPKLFVTDAIAKKLDSIPNLKGLKRVGLIPQPIWDVIDNIAFKKSTEANNKSAMVKSFDKNTTILIKSEQTPESEKIEFSSYSFLQSQVDEASLSSTKLNFVFVNIKPVLKKQIVDHFERNNSPVFFLDLIIKDYAQGLGAKKADEFFLKNQEKISALYFSYFLGLADKKLVFVFFENQGLIFELVVRILKNIGFNVLFWPQNIYSSVDIPSLTQSNSFDWIVSQQGNVKPRTNQDQMAVDTHSLWAKKILSDNKKNKILNFFNLESDCKKIFLFLECPAKYSVSKFKAHVHALLKKILENSDKFDGFVFFISGSDVANLLNDDLYQAVLSSDLFVILGQKSMHVLDDYELAEVCDIVVSAEPSILCKASLCGATAVFMDSMKSSKKFAESPDNFIVVGGEEFNINKVGIIEILKKKTESHAVSDNYESEGVAESFNNLISFFSDGKNQDFLLNKNAFNLDELLSSNLVCASEFGENALSTTNIYLAKMLGVSEIIQSNPKVKNVDELAKADFFVQWGIKPTHTKKWQNQVRRSFFRPLIIIEDGFVRSIDIGVSGSAGLSIILDDITSYYDSTKASRLELTLQHGRGLTDEELYMSELLMKKIVDNKVSKYNHAPVLPLKIGRPDRPKILLVDQRYGDQSVESGLGSPQSFDAMLRDAIKEYPDHDILIKQHPDATLGGKSSYFSAEKMEFTKYTENIFLINFDVNPYCLFDLVDEVFVCTSGMGFEALLAGKSVRCYGIPFYSGWGLTQDQQSLERRSRNRSLQEVFFFSYIQFSVYFSPSKNARCTLSELIDYIVSVRGW